MPKAFRHCARVEELLGVDLRLLHAHSAEKMLVEEVAEGDTSRACQQSSGDVVHVVIVLYSDQG